MNYYGKLNIFICSFWLFFKQSTGLSHFQEQAAIGQINFCSWQPHIWPTLLYCLFAGCISVAVHILMALQNLWVVAVCVCGCVCVWRRVTESEVRSHLSNQSVQQIPGLVHSVVAKRNVGEKHWIGLLACPTKAQEGKGCFFPGATKDVVILFFLLAWENSVGKKFIFSR